MASITEKLTKLETKIEKRKSVIKTETDKLNADLEEYNKLYLMALADKYKLSGKALFSAIEREHEQLAKLCDGDMSDKDIECLTESSSFVKVNEDAHSSFSHNFTDEEALNE